jgi:hypothetical protein
MAVACTVVTYILISTPAINRINGFSMIFWNYTQKYLLVKSSVHSRRPTFFFNKIYFHWVHLETIRMSMAEINILPGPAICGFGPNIF